MLASVTVAVVKANTLSSPVVAATTEELGADTSLISMVIVKTGELGKNVLLSPVSSRMVGGQVAFLSNECNRWEARGRCVTKLGSLWSGGREWVVDLGDGSDK